MKALVWRGMADGAVGFSTGLQYVPGTYAQTWEIIELARVAGNEGGVYASHMRNEGTALEEAVTETIRVGEMSGLPRADFSSEGRQPQPLGCEREGARAHRRCPEARHDRRSRSVRVHGRELVARHPLPLVGARRRSGRRSTRA